jgi:hypothetical protein
MIEFPLGVSFRFPHLPIVTSDKPVPLGEMSSNQFVAPGGSDKPAA